MSTTQEATNKAAVKRFDDALNSGDAQRIFKTIDEVVAPDALIRTPLPIKATGAELAKELWGRLLRAYPDLHITIEDLIAEGDKVVSRNTVTGTHQGEYMGIPPTSKSVTYNEVIITRWADGHIVETWAVVDVLAQMRQLGVIPAAPGQPAAEEARPAA
jgi:predicted ester cyclase